MKLLITGICGFVGSALAHELRSRREGLQICGIGNLSRPDSEQNRYPLQHHGVRFFQGDIRNPSDLSSFWIHSYRHKRPVKHIGLENIVDEIPRHAELHPQWLELSNAT